VLRAERLAAEAVARERAADLTQAQIDLDSLEQLARKEAANPKELADARAAQEASIAREVEAKNRIVVIDARIELTEGRIADMTIRAPFAGMIAERISEVGSWLGEGQAVAELVSVDELEARLEVPQQYLRPLEAARQGLEIRVDASGERIEAGVPRLLLDVDRRGRTFLAVTALPAESGLAPGMSVTAWIPTGEKARHLTVSQDAVLRNTAGEYVYAVVQQSPEEPPRAAPVQLEVLFQAGSRVVVREGPLKPGQQVVVEGNERLYPMAVVQPAPASAGGASR
jgi:RND family efflux transporter MFP subunit